METPSRTILEQSFPATLDMLVEKYCDPQFAGARVSLWVFDGAARRHAAEETLRAAGVEARIRSAYKPLVHALLEDLALSDARAVVVRYPVVAAAPASRFLLECYPASDLVAPCPLRFEPMPVSSGAGLLPYRVAWTARDGTPGEATVLAPTRLAADWRGGTVLLNTGWEHVAAARDGGQRSGVVVCDLERAFQAVAEAFAHHPWRETRPYFARLAVRVEAPFCDFPLPDGIEHISTAEGMHEDLYFTALELFRALSGASDQDRAIQPGQIVPDIVTREDGTVRVRVATQPFEVVDDVATAPLCDLATADHWLQPESIKAHLDALGGEPYEALSQCGRPVWGVHLAGKGPGLAVSGGQHPNETSGVVGALRAAQQIERDGGINLAVSPLDNPDGYALFRQLCKTHPRHMHHAARYTAGGGDLDHLGPCHENRIRQLAREKTGADLHVNLHGYPAHEWTRPLTGYLPRGFDLWTIPKGFFLILRHHAGWRAQGEALLEAITSDLACYQPLVDLTRAQLARYRLYVPGHRFDLRNGFPVVIDEADHTLFPLTIITEMPDETVYGEAFVVAHTAQMKTVLAAAVFLRQQG